MVMPTNHAIAGSDLHRAGPWHLGRRDPNVGPGPAQI